MIARIIRIIGVWLLLVLPLGFANASTVSYDKVLTVAIDATYPPFSFRENGKYVGFDLDLLAAVAKEAGFKYQIKPMDFVGVIPSLQAGLVDMAVAAMTVRPNRAEVVDFSTPYYETALVAMSKKGNGIRELDDLAGKIIGTKLATAPADFVSKQFPKADIKLFDSIATSVMALRSGMVDAVVFDEPVMIYYAKSQGVDNFEMSSPFGSKDHYAIGLPKGSPMTAVVDKALAEIHRNGVYDAIYDKWLRLR